MLDGFIQSHGQPEHYCHTAAGKFWMCMDHPCCFPSQGIPPPYHLMNMHSVLPTSIVPQCPSHTPKSQAIFTCVWINYNHHNHHYIETTKYTMFKQCFPDYHTSDNHLKAKNIPPSWLSSHAVPITLNVTKTTKGVQHIARELHLTMSGIVHTISYGNHWNLHRVQLKYFVYILHCIHLSISKDIGSQLLTMRKQCSKAQLHHCASACFLNLKPCIHKQCNDWTSFPSCSNVETQTTWNHCTCGSQHRCWTQLTGTLLQLGVLQQL